MILPSSMTASWPAFRRYVHTDGRVHWDALRADYGEHDVPVVIDGQERQTMRLHQALDLVVEANHAVYIKDWHLVRFARTHCKDPDRLLPYRTPALFADDCTFCI